jgi:hypothetical protein
MPLDKYSLQGIIAMDGTWRVEYRDEFESWWRDLSEDAQEAVAHDIDVLAAIGPGLGRPFVDTVHGSRYPNMKELRTSHRGHAYRVLFAFDPRRTAILLIGGDKTGDPRFYRSMIRRADRAYGEHLHELRQRGEIA